LILALVVAAMVIICLLIFAPFTFEVHPARAPVTWNGLPVVQHGFSRIHQKTFFSGHVWNGDIIDGRCFIDVVDNGRERRIYGRRLTRRISRNPNRFARVRTLLIR
jgi:hypothetical protein